MTDTTTTAAKATYADLRVANEDVQQLMLEVMASKGYGSVTQFAEQDPEGFIGLVEELRSMVAQTLTSADSHVKVAEPSRD
jgi:hypothetical protein